MPATALVGQMSGGDRSDNAAFEELMPRPEAARPNSDSALRSAVLTVLHVEIPSARRADMEPVWNHLREDVLPGPTGLRLRRNGLRIGVGHEQWWEAIKAALDAVPDARCRMLDPVHLPPGFPLALELDEHPRAQTLFYVGADGVLSGETWPDSRNVLRLTCAADPTRARRAHLSIVPEVRQRRDGWRWVRSGTGVAQTPNYDGRAFGAAGFVVSLDPGEFLLLAPSQEADAFGIIGGALLTRGSDDQRLDSYVFLRADLTHVPRSR